MSARELRNGLKIAIWTERKQKVTPFLWYFGRRGNSEATSIQSLTVLRSSRVCGIHCSRCLIQPVCESDGALSIVGCLLIIADVGSADGNGHCCGTCALTLCDSERATDWTGLAIDSPPLRSVLTQELLELREKRATEEGRKNRPTQTNLVNLSTSLIFSGRHCRRRFALRSRSAIGPRNSASGLHELTELMRSRKPGAF
jgi:hypothetical protein